VRGGLVIALAVAGILVNLGRRPCSSTEPKEPQRARAFLHVTTDLAAFAERRSRAALILVTVGTGSIRSRASPLRTDLWSSAILLASPRGSCSTSAGRDPPDEVAEAMLVVPDVVEVHGPARLDGR